MTALNSITPAAPILDDQGFDWSWAFVDRRPIPGFPGYFVGNDGEVWTSFRHSCCQPPGPSIRGP